MTLGLPASAQQLWRVEEVTTRLIPPIEVGGVAAVPQAAGAGGPLTVAAATVQVEFDYLRLGMGYLELPLMDGSVVAAENAVFEDRGNGNLMWTGEVPGAGYESVVLTVQDGYLVGWFGEPGGPKYVVHAGPDGRGSLAVEVGPTGDWCGVDAAAGEVTGLDRALVSVDHPASAGSASNDSRLDILVLYTEGTEHYWRAIGGTAVGVRQLGDYLNMAFRNGAIPATANLIPVRWEPQISSHPAIQGWHHLPYRSGLANWYWEFESSAEVARLRKRYEPDLIHFVPEVGIGPLAGRAYLRWHLDPQVLMGWSIPIVTTFAHEIGHNLGGRHDPLDFGGEFAEVQRGAFRPYLFGHTDFSSCRKLREGSDWPSCPSTIMSTGVDARRREVGVEEPFYSSVRHKPNGWTIGVAGTSELGARVTSPDNVRLHWRDNSGVETGHEVWYRKWSGGEPEAVWRLYGEPLPARTRYVDIGGLAAEEEIQVTDWDSKGRSEQAKIGRYSFVVVAYNDKGWNASETFDLEFMPGPYPEQTTSGEVTDCYVRPTGVDLDGYQVYACLETPDGARRRAWDYGLEAEQSALLYFFGEDNAEILVKVLDGCALNGHRWVFVAPVTDLPFKLEIREVGPYQYLEGWRQRWQYDSKRRLQRRYGDSSFGNPKSRTARTVSDTTAFPCTTAEIAAAKSRASQATGGESALPAHPRRGGERGVPSARRLSSGFRTDCAPSGAALTLAGGYEVSMC
jgi:hypothetical protein